MLHIHTCFNLPILPKAPYHYINFSRIGAKIESYSAYLCVNYCQTGTFQLSIPKSEKSKIGSALSESFYWVWGSKEQWKLHIYCACNPKLKGLLFSSQKKIRTIYTVL